jgi:glycosyltransferase involved in cell wall biosynthesis
MPRVTAIIPAHNGEAFIRTAIASVLAQTYRDCEVVVADDGSRDGTAAIVESFGPAVRLIRVAHGNTQATRNAAVDASDSAFIGLLDQDDAWWPEKIEHQLGLLASDPRLGLCSTAARGVDAAGCEILGARAPAIPENQADALGRLLAVNLVAASTVILPRAVIHRVGAFDAAFHLAGDWDLWLRVAEEYPIASVPKVLTDYRWHGENLSRNPVPMLGESIAVQEAALARVARHPRWAKAPGLAPYLGPARHRLASRYSELGVRYAKMGSSAQALSSHREALRLDPLVPLHWWRLLLTLVRVPWPGSEGPR